MVLLTAAGILSARHLSQVLLQMKAASLNYRDLLVPQRGYGALTGTLPLIPISDGVGEVIAIGEGVRRVAVGDRVCPVMIQSWISGPPITWKGFLRRWEVHLTV